jgi:hypothetical protein
VGDDGSIDWLCGARFDSGARLPRSWETRTTTDGAGCRWPARRRYRDGTVLETEFDTPEGSVKVIDFMPIRDQTVEIIRIVEGIRGHVAMRMHLTIRFDWQIAVGAQHRWCPRRRRRPRRGIAHTDDAAGFSTVAGSRSGAGNEFPSPRGTRLIWTCHGPGTRSRP